MLRKTEQGLAVLALLLGIIIVAIGGIIVWRGLNSSGSQQPSSNPPLVTNDQTNDQNKYDIYPEVWTQNGYDGASYEFKVNCGPNYRTLKECFLWDLTQVTVTNPSGQQFNLEKDFNTNTYSGEVTRRWVLYGEAKAGFPKSGTYTFDYYQSKTKIFSQNLDYQPEIIGYPTNIVWQRSGTDLKVSWQPPEGMKAGMWYKVLIFQTSGNLISQQVDWDKSSTTLKDVPLSQGEKADMNVSSYFRGGYAYPKSVEILWL